MVTEDAETRGRVTVHDVAEMAGVSAMTVSRVLNRSPHVADATAEKVRAAMTQIGFRLNQSARNLRRKQSVTIVGLVVGDIANPYFAKLSEAVAEVAQAHHALLVMASYGADASRESEVITALLERGLDGLLVSPTAEDHGFLTEELLDDRPVVFLGRQPQGLAADAIHPDHADGIMQAVRHLHSYGHTRIGVVGFEHEGGRFEGYRRALSEYSIVYDPDLMCWCTTVDDATRSVHELMSRSDAPTALVTFDNRMTVGTLRALGTGLRGRALVGFDDFDLADVVDPPISVVTHDSADVGRQAADMLFSRLSGDDAEVREVRLPMTLIARGSGERRP